MEEATISDLNEHHAKKGCFSGLRLIEKISLAVVAALFITLIVSGIFWLRAKNKLVASEQVIDLPVTGEFAKISEIETYWVGAIGKKGVNPNAYLLPSASISLDSSHSKKGALKILFYNPQDQSIGDTIIVSFEGGQFDTSGTNTIEVFASNGLSEESTFLSYQIDQKTNWTIRILEAASTDSAGSEFEELLKAEVSINRK